MNKETKLETSEFMLLMHMLKEQKTMLEMLMPKKASISYIAQSVGKTNEAVRQFLMNHYKEGKDFWKEGGKIMVSQETAVALMMRSK